jgi:membrane protein
MSSIASAVKSHLGQRCHALLGAAVHALHTLRRAALSANEHDALNIAQATAYSAMFALFPALIVAAALVGLLPDSLPFRVQMATFFDRILPSNVSPLLETYFTKSSHGPMAHRALLGSVIVSISGATGVMTTLMEGFRRAHKLPLLRSNFWPARLRALALVPLSLVPMAAASALVVFGHLATVLLARDISPTFRPTVYVIAFILRWFIALAGSTAIIAVIYHLGTDLTRHMREHLQPFVREPWYLLRRDWSWSASLPGAAVATVLWFLSTLLFGYYVTRFANYSRVYGSLGAAIALMFWLFLIALSVLIGAEFNAQRTVAHRDAELSELLWKLPGLRKRRTGRIAD